MIGNNKYNQGLSYEIKDIDDYPSIEELKRQLTEDLAEIEG